MNVSLLERQRGDIPLGALLMTVLFALPFGGWLVEQGYLQFGACGMKEILGVPCLTCGSTRATLYLLHGDLGGALQLQPMLITIYAILFVWGMTSLSTFLAGRRVAVELSDSESLAFKVSLVVVPLVNWGYLVWAGV